MDASAPRHRARFSFHIAPLVLLIAVTGLLLYLVLHTVDGRTIDIGVAGDTRFTSGFFPAEVGEGATLRWSGMGSELVLHGAGPGLHTLDARFHGGQLATSGSNRLGLTQSSREVAALTVQPGWRTYHVLLPAGALAAPLGDAPRIQFVSAVFPVITDKREVGVALDWIRIAPIKHGVVQDTGALRRAFVLTWMLAVLAGLLWRVDQLIFHTRIMVRAWRVMLPVVVAAAMAIWWSRRDPYIFAWFLPATPWLLGLVTLGLAGGLLGRGLASRLMSASRAGTTAAVLPWIGVAALVIAQSLFHASVAIGSGIAIALAGLMLLQHVLPTPWAERPASGERMSRGTLLALALIVLVALAFRFYRIESLPYGMWRDESAHGIVALHMVEQPGYRPVYVPEVDLPGLGLAPFALALRLWGIHPWSMRPITAIAGALTVLPLYGFVHCLTGRHRVALLAAGLLAVSSWSLSISRLSFPHIFDPLLTLTGLWLMLVGLQGLDRPVTSRRRLVVWGTLLLAGFCLGLALHTYHTGRIAPLVAALLALCWLLRRPRLWRRWTAAVLLLALGYLGATWPLLSYAVQHPELFNGRVNEVFVLSETALKGRAPLAVVDRAIGRHLLMFNIRGDTNGRHHAPGRPMLDWLTGIGFLAGAAIVVRSWRDWRSLFLLGALGLGLMPSILAVDAPHALRSFDAAAFAIVIAAFGWSSLAALIPMPRPALAASGMWASLTHRYASGGGVLLVLAALGLNAWTYFVAMPVTPNVWRAFYPVQTQIGAYLRHVAEDQGSRSLEHVYLKESIAENSVTTYLLHGLKVQTFDGTLVSSAPPPDALFVLSGYSYQRDAQMLAEYLGTAPRPVHVGPLLPDGKSPSFVVYERR